ncbi:hypothetical protein CABS01_07759 [Colletotrichum abscissum]|uniref:Uncharacterized protein n=1 Tax=Colletotrichum abscissum TaxID=1671311 RepID=A0A9P9XQP8_9PEZI|nr:uncharacterized protein CABS01_07759 [Colletotrichum abscissum]KAI3557836.1 hypothetical protein CABS02_02018 [Colletotrichum abscissum]KAK1510087.1 hypothetical protein CABS01_07759 [Colletotrichum abscissum]
MSAEDNGQGSRDPLIPRGDNFIPFERSDVRRSRVKDALNQTNVLAPSQSPTQTPPSGRRGIEESPTTGGIAGHVVGPSTSTAPSTAQSQRDSVSAGQQTLTTLTTPTTAVSNTNATTQDNEQADFLICGSFLIQHNWQSHVHINDQYLIVHEEAAQQRLMGPIGSRHNARSRALKPYQSRATKVVLEERPTYRLTIQGWDHFVTIIGMLDQNRPRPEDEHRNHRITCISTLWRSQYGNDRPGFGMQTDISDANKAILNRSIRNAMTFLLDPEGENSSTSFIDDEIYLTDQRNNPASQTQQVEHSEGAGAIDVHPTVMEFIHGLSAEECDYYIAVLKLLNIQGTG